MLFIPMLLEKAEIPAMLRMLNSDWNTKLRLTLKHLLLKPPLCQKARGGKRTKKNDKIGQKKTKAFPKAAVYGRQLKILQSRV